MKTIIVVQTRMGLTRLPDKVLKYPVFHIPFERLN